MKVKDLICEAVEVADKDVSILDGNGNDLDFSTAISNRYGYIIKTDTISITDHNSEIHEKDTEIEELKAQIEELNLKIVELEMTLAIENAIKD